MKASRLIGVVRQADWLDPQRARAYSLILLIMSALGFAIWIGLAEGLIDRTGKPLGSDFMSFYSASKLALAGHAADAWRPEAHQAAQTAVFARRFDYWAFFYPPPYLLVCWPLALLPYGVSLAAWAVSTTAAFVGLMRLWLRNLSRQPVFASYVFLAMPVLWLNLGYGQNGALIAAILAGGCLMLDRRPVLAGLILGMLVIKPQLALAVPFVLAATGRWKTFFATAAGAMALLAASWLAVGPEGFSAFMANSALARATLEQGLVDPGAMQSGFGAFRALGAPVPIAYAGQLLIAIFALAVATFAAWKVRADAFGAAAVIAAATPLISPFFLVYDLAITAIPLTWLVVQGTRTGFRHWEKAAALLVFVLPFVSRTMTVTFHLPLAPVILLVLLILVVRRLLAANGQGVDVITEKVSFPVTSAT